MLKILRMYSKVIKFESLCSTCHFKFWLFLAKNDDFYIKPKRNSRMAGAWDQGGLSPWMDREYVIKPHIGTCRFFLLAFQPFPTCTIKMTRPICESIVLQYTMDFYLDWKSLNGFIFVLERRHYESIDTTWTKMFASFADFST